MSTLPTFQKGRAGVWITWGNQSTLILWTQWDWVVSMMARGIPDQTSVLSATTSPVAFGFDEQPEQIREAIPPYDYIHRHDGEGVLDDVIFGAIADEPSGAEGEAGYTTEETTHSG